jgi:hypothetical protein
MEASASDDVVSSQNELTSTTTMTTNFFYRILQFQPSWSLIALLRTIDIPHTIENIPTPSAIGMPAPVSIVTEVNRSNDGSGFDDTIRSNNFVLPLKPTLDSISTISQSRLGFSESHSLDINLSSYIELDLNGPLNYLLVVDGDFNSSLLQYSGVLNWAFNKIQTEVSLLLAPLPSNGISHKSLDQIYDDLESSYKYIDAQIDDATLAISGCKPFSEAILFGHIMDVYSRFGKSNRLSEMIDGKFPKLIKFAERMSRSIFVDIFNQPDANNSNQNSVRFRNHYLYEANKVVLENYFLRLPMHPFVPNNFFNKTPNPIALLTNVRTFRNIDKFYI